jgi:hypothetical protein
MPARRSETDGPHNGKGHGHRPPRKNKTEGPHDHNDHGHKPHDPPYFDPDYEHPPDHDHEPPDNPR